MASLGPLHKISLPISEGNTTQLELTSIPGTIVVTIDNRRIVLFNVKDHHLVADWTVGANQLSCPAVLHGDPQQLSVVFNHTRLCTWNKNESQVEKGKKKITTQHIHGLWVPHGRSCPYLVHSNCSISSADDPDVILEPPPPPFTPVGELSQPHSTASIIWKDQVIDEKCNILCVVHQNKRSGESGCVVYDWHSESNTMTCTSYTIPTPSTTRIISYSLCHHQHNVYLFLLDSSGMLRRMCISGRNNNTKGSMTQLNQIPNICDSAAISALDSDQVAVVGLKGPDETISIGTWDTKFGLLHGSRSLKSLKPLNSLYRVGRQLFVQCTQGLYACTYTPNTGSLCAAMGALTRNHGDSSIPTSNKNIVKGQEIFQKLADSNKTSTLESFHSTFESLTEWLEKAQAAEVLGLGPEIGRFVKRISEEKIFTPNTEMYQTLLDHDVIQGRHLELLLPGLIDKKQTQLIHALVSRVSCVPESVIVPVLTYYIRSLPKMDKIDMKADKGDKGDDDDDDDDGDDDDEENDQIACPQCLYQESDAVYIDAVLRLPFNGVFLVDYLKEMDFVLIVDLLKHLCYLSSWAPATPSLATAKGVPTLSQVFEWCCMCLDAHLSQVMVSFEAKPIIFSLTEQVQQQMLFYKELGSLDGILKQLRQKWLQKPQEGAKYYCIQTLHVK